MSEQNERMAAVGRVLTMLTATYDKAISKERAQVYMVTLRDIDPDLLHAAALRYIERATFPDIPTPGKLRLLAAEIVAAENGVVPPPDAWGEVMRELRRVGNWRAPVFSHELIAQAVNSIGGWQHLATTENVTADRARFIEAYESAQREMVHGMIALPESRRLAERRAAAPQIEDGTPRGLKSISEVLSQIQESQ